MSTTRVTLPRPACYAPLVNEKYSTHKPPLSCSNRHSQNTQHFDQSHLHLDELIPKVSTLVNERRDTLLLGGYYQAAGFSRARPNEDLQRLNLDF